VGDSFTAFTHYADGVSPQCVPSLRTRNHRSKRSADCGVSALISSVVLGKLCEFSELAFFHW
jgi:hypothetical protein